MTSGHWIAGSFDGAGGVWAAPGDPAGSSPWPRAGAEELERARQALAARGPAWRRLSAKTRVERLRPALPVFVRGPAASLPEALGLSAQTLPAALLRPPSSVEPPFGAGLDGGESAVLVVADWREGPAGLLRRVLGELAAGRAVIALPHALWPAAGALVARALDACGPLPAAVLFDDGATVVRAAAGQPDLACRAYPTDERVRALDSAGRLAVRYEPMARRTAVVLEGDRPGPAARRIARAAFGRAETLSGQLFGAVGRVLCHELRFAELSAELVRGLEGAWRDRPPVPLVEPATERRAAEVLGRALDEGACLVFGGERWQGPGPRVRALVPALVTNADPDRRVVRTPWPVPLLALARVRDDSEARERARGLDAEPWAVCDGGPSSDPGSPRR